FCFVLRLVALEIVGFHGAAAGEILGIEIQHDPFAFEVVQADGFAFLRIQREVRSCSPNCRCVISCRAYRTNPQGNSDQSNDHYGHPDQLHWFHLIFAYARVHSFAALCMVLGCANESEGFTSLRGERPGLPERWRCCYFGWVNRPKPMR